MTLAEKLSTIEQLISEVHSELSTKPDKADVRTARYSELSERLIAAQILSNTRWLIQAQKKG